MTSLKNVDFLDLLENSLQDNDDLFDVQIVVQNAKGEEQGSIKAHKVFLSVVSPVFKRMFCGPFRSAPSEENETEPGGLPLFTVVAPSFPAFKKLVNFLYSGDEKIVTGVTELDMLFELCRLSDQYLMFGMKRLVRGTIDKFPITLHNYAQVLRLCREFEELANFEEMCFYLGLRCAVSVRSELNFTSDKLMETNSNEEEPTRLLLMQKLKLANKFYCLNCHKFKENCLNGQTLTVENGKIGMRVRATASIYADQDWVTKKGIVGLVKSVHKAPVAIQCPVKAQTYNGIGSVEWNTGKERQLSIYGAPDQLVGIAIACLVK